MTKFLIALAVFGCRSDVISAWIILAGQLDIYYIMYPIFLSLPAVVYYSEFLIYGYWNKRFKVPKCYNKIHGATPHELLHVEDIEEAPGFGDAEHRGPAWYSIDTSVSDTSNAPDSSETSSDLSTSSESGVKRRSETDSASSAVSNEEHRAKRKYRVCTPCAHDMMKKHSNLGIKWICGGYQRARRTFKSECMMRFRNCQDGTMFIKLSDMKCKNDTYHGRHWFYIYKV